jgi:hypothetical protein
LAGKQGCFAADKLAARENNVVSPQTTLSGDKTTLSAAGQRCRSLDNVIRSQDNVIRDKSRLPAGKQGCLVADKLVSLPPSLRRA